MAVASVASGSANGVRLSSNDFTFCVRIMQHAVFMKSHYPHVTDADLRGANKNRARHIEWPRRPINGQSADWRQFRRVATATHNRMTSSIHSRARLTETGAHVVMSLTSRVAGRLEGWLVGNSTSSVFPARRGDALPASSDRYPGQLLEQLCGV